MGEEMWDHITERRKALERFSRVCEEYGARMHQEWGSKDVEDKLAGLRRGFEIAEERDRVARASVRQAGKQEAEQGMEERDEDVCCAPVSSECSNCRKREREAELWWEVWVPKNDGVLALFYDGSPEALRALKRRVKARGKESSGVWVKGPRDVEWMRIPNDVWVVSNSGGTYCYDDADFREKYRRVEK